MKKDASHIQKIMVVSNTHWDREFRKSSSGNYCKECDALLVKYYSVKNIQ